MKIPLSKPYVDEREIAAVSEVLRSSTLSLGPKTEAFEKSFASLIGAKYGVAVNSGTSGLHLAVKAMGIGTGDEVITSPFSFVASANCVLYEGAKPVFVDIEEETFGLDPTLLEDRINGKTRAILPVHVFGMPCAMQPVTELASKHQLVVIEDACEAAMASYHGRMIGSLGDISVFGFYPNKQMTTGEGGMILTESETTYAMLKSLRNQGRTDDMQWLTHDRLGYNYRISEITAAIGLVQTAKLPEIIEKRAAAAQLYLQYLQDIEEVILPKEQKNVRHSWFVFTVRVPSRWRQTIIEQLSARGIQSKAYFYPCIHLQPYYREKFGYAKGDFPIAERVSEETIALPFFTDITEEQIREVVENLKDILVAL